jgi:hypothetical protein
VVAFVLRGVLAELAGSSRKAEDLFQQTLDPELWNEEDPFGGLDIAGHIAYEEWIGWSVLWAQRLRRRRPETLADIVPGDAVMEKAMTTLEVLSQDDHTRLLYEARQMALHDYASAIARAKDEGREEGLHRKAVEVAHKLLLAKTPLSTVVEITGLSQEELHRLCPSVD